MFAVCIVWIVLQINTSTKLVQRILKVVLVIKSLTMLSIVLGGFWWMTAKGYGSLSSPFAGKTLD